MLQLGRDAVSTRFKTASARFLHKPLWNWSAAGLLKILCWNVLNECWRRMIHELCCKASCIPLMFIRPAAGLIKQHRDSSVDECRSTQLYTESGKVDETDVPLPPDILSPDAADESENMLKGKGSKHARSKKKWSSQWSRSQKRLRSRESRSWRTRSHRNRPE